MKNKSVFTLDGRAHLLHVLTLAGLQNVGGLDLPIEEAVEKGFERGLRAREAPAIDEQKVLNGCGLREEDEEPAAPRLARRQYARFVEADLVSRGRQPEEARAIAREAAREVFRDTFTKSEDFRLAKTFRAARRALEKARPAVSVSKARPPARPDLAGHRVQLPDEDDVIEFSTGACRLADDEEPIRDGGFSVEIKEEEKE